MGAREELYEILPYVEDGYSDGIERVKKLVTSDPSLLYWYDDPDKPSWGIYTTALHRTESLELAKFFVEMDSNLIDTYAYSGDMPIHIAAREGRLEIVKFLIGQRPNAVRERGGQFGNTPMIMACVNFQFEVMKYLFEMDPESLDDRARFGRNLLHCTFIRETDQPNILDTAKWILRKRPHFAFEEDIHNETPLCFAKERNPCSRGTPLLDRFCQLHELVNAINEVVHNDYGIVPPSTDEQEERTDDSENEHEKLVLSALAVVAQVLRDDIENLIAP